jgi:hypothetical protein
MIKSKIDLIKLSLDGYNLRDEFVKKVIRKTLALPELEFIDFVKNDLNYRIEPIRKNLYIVSC